MERTILNKLPSVDLNAFYKGCFGLQHAPLYSQNAYNTMREKEVCLGNYFTSANCKFATMGAFDGGRNTIVLLIEKVH